ncbi:MAG: hypothetical protein IPN71_08270 [Fibrobacteres bacterium]|nr:hypothetical protein [Fibrobacterota bacterium]
MNTRILSIPVRFRLEGSLPEAIALALLAALDIFQYIRSPSEIPLFVVAFAMVSHRFACAKFFRVWREEAQAWRTENHRTVATGLRWLELAGSAAVAIFLVWFLGVV